MSNEQEEDTAFEQMMALREGRGNEVCLDTLRKPTVGIGYLALPGDNLNVGDRITDAQVDAFSRETVPKLWRPRERKRAGRDRQYRVHSLSRLSQFSTGR
jgi:hypothetical protein